MVLQWRSNLVITTFVVLYLISPSLATKCPKCPPGQQPRSCYTHQPWSSQCAPCPRNTFSKHWTRALCRPCSPCPDGYYRARRCSSTRDTVCYKCKSPADHAACRSTGTASKEILRNNKKPTGRGTQTAAGRHYGGHVTSRLRLRTGAGPPYREETFQQVQALPQKGPRRGNPKAMTHVGVYVGIGIGLAAILVLAIVIWCCCRNRQCCSRPSEDELDDPSKPTYVAMTPITPGEKDHLVFPAVSSSPHHVVLVSIPNGDCTEGKALGHGPIDIPCLGLLDDGDDIKFIDESSSDEDYPHTPHETSSRTLDKDYPLQSSLLTPPTGRCYAQETSSPSLSTRPLLKSDCEQSTDTLDSSLIHSNDSILDRTPVDDLEPEIAFAGRKKRPRSPDPFAVEEDQPLLDKARTQKVNEANGVPCNWWDTQSTSSSDGSEPHDDHDRHQMIPIIIGSHHHQCPNTEHSLTELERQFDAMISDWEQFQQGNKDTSCPYYIYEDQCLETIPESPEFDYQESETSRCSSISALYPWRKPPYVRHPPPPTDSESSSDSDDNDMPKFDGLGSADLPRFGPEPDDGGPGLLMHSPLMEDLRSIGRLDQLGSSSSSTSSLHEVLEINAGGHDNHAVILTSSDDEDRPPDCFTSESSLTLEQKLSVVRPSSFAEEEHRSQQRPLSLIEDRSHARVAVNDRPHSMVELDDRDELAKPLRTNHTNNNSSTSSSSTCSSSSSSDDSSLLKDRNTPVVYENKMFQE